VLFEVEPRLSIITYFGPR